MNASTFASAFASTSSYVRIPTAIHAIAGDGVRNFAPDSVAVFRAADSDLPWVLAATNGKALALVPTDGVTPSTDNGPWRTVMPSALVRSARATHRKAHHTCVPLVHDEGRSFPPVEVALPKEVKDRAVVRLDAALLMDLAKALGSDGAVTLLVSTSKPDAPIVVMPSKIDCGDSKAIGVLAPIVRNDRDEQAAHDEANERLRLVRSIVSTA